MIIFPKIHEKTHNAYFHMLIEININFFFLLFVYRLLENIKNPVASRTSSGFKIDDILKLNDTKPPVQDETNGKIINNLLKKLFFYFFLTKNGEK